VSNDDLSDIEMQVKTDARAKNNQSPSANSKKQLKVAKENRIQGTKPS
jgi:hypothetical protein